MRRLLVAILLLTLTGCVAEIDGSYLANSVRIGTPPLTRTVTCGPDSCTREETAGEPAPK